MNNKDRALLRISGLKVSFEHDSERIEVIHDIDLQIFPGKTMALVGESGSGKSVTSLSLMGLLPSKSSKVVANHITLQGETSELDLIHLKKESWQEIRGTRIAMIFQEPMTSLNPVMKCGLQVDEVLRRKFNSSSKKAKEKTLHLFEQVKLPDPERAYNSYPHQLSGGQRQRVMIAMALSGNPDLLIADEPTTALDVIVQKSILDLLSDLQKKRNMAVLFITHDLGVVADIADHVVVMYQGSLMEEGEVKQVLHHPKHDYTRGLLACRPVFGKRLKRMPVLSDFFPETEEKKATFLREEYSSDEVFKEPLIRIKDLSKTFYSRKNEAVQAVKSVTFDIMKGETLGLVGQSGCGKSTLSRLLIGLETPSSGEIYFGELKLDNEKRNRSQASKMQMVFQDPYSSLNPRHTIGQAIMEPMKIHGENLSGADCKGQCMLLLEEVGLQEESFGRYPHEFSGGQRQRIAIARALSTNPDFLICDEAVSALDVSVQAQVLNLLQDLKASKGLTYLFISHDMAVVNQMSDRILVMNEGQIEEINDAFQIIHHPKSEYTSNLIAAIPGKSL